MGERRRIVWLIDGLGRGGAEHLMVPILAHIDRARFELRVCALQVKDGNPVAGELRALGVPVDLLPVPRLRDLTALPRLLQYLRREQADLLHTQLEFATTLGGPAARLLGIPAVTTLHTYDEPLPGSRAARRLRWMWWSMRRFFSRVIGVSEGVGQHHIRKSRLDPQKVVVIYNGIDLSRFSPVDPADRSRVRRELGIPEGAPLLLTVAVLRQPKGIQIMIDAMPAILAAVPSVYYGVVGSGDYGEALRAQAVERKVADRVIFTGFRDDIPRLMAAADVFVLPTLTEALPTVLAEAMALSRPIIASAVGGVPEMVTDGSNGLLLPPADPAALARACISLAADPDRAQAMGRRGRSVVEARFDIVKQVRRLEALYDELLA
jgi:glycosyltransferase involved in cell wall biosynthesis